jgi:hypothetical protein
LSASRIPDFSKLLNTSALVSALTKLSDSSASSQPPAGVGAVSPDYLLDQRNPVNIVNRLSDAYTHFKEELEQAVSRYSDVLQASGGAIDMSKELKEKVDRYSRALEELKNAEGQQIQDVLSKYKDVLSYDPKTGRVAPSKELVEMLSRYSQAVQEVGKLTNAMSTVAGMIQTFAQQLPVLPSVKFQTYDPAQKKFVEVGGETPIYVKDEKMREEIRRWLEQNKDKVKVAAFYDPNKPVVYVYNDKDEGYIIFPATGEARRAKGVSGMVGDTAKAVWYKSLTDREKKELERWLEVQRRREEIEQMTPVARELYAALIGAGRFAVVTPALDVLSRWLRGEDPTKGLEKFEAEAAAAAQASPTAHAVGQAVGLAGVGGFAAEALIARGAAAGASGVGRQFLTGLRSTLKPTVAGATAGAAFGAVEGALTGRDPLAEAAKFGFVGLLTGLGGVPRHQLIAGGLLGGVVGASTAKEHGVEKGLEAGSTVFFLPIVAPVERGIGGIAMGTAKRPVAGLKAESIPAVEGRYTQIVRELAAQVRSGLEKKPLPGLTLEEAAAVAARLRARPAEQREFFMQLAEDAAAKIRAGDDVALVQLRLLRDKLDPVSKMRLDEVLRQYGLSEVKHKTPEYGLTEETAPALARLFRREPEYALRDEDAQAIDRLFRRDMQRTPGYQLTDESATLLDQFLKMPHEALAFRPAVAELQPPAARRRRVRYAPRQEPWFALKPKATLGVSTGRTEVEVAGQLGPVLTRRLELEVSARQSPQLRQELRPALTAKAEIQLPAQRQGVDVETGRSLNLPEVRTALVHALKPRAEAVPEPEVPR